MPKYKKKMKTMKEKLETDKWGHIFLWVYHKDDPSSPWEPFEVQGPYFNRITTKGYDCKRRLSTTKEG